jgi:uncharacterized protein YigE (DUF2233 family)
MHIIRSLIIFTLFLTCFCVTREQVHPKIIGYIVDPRTTHIQLFWKNDKGELFRNIGALKDWLEGNKQTLFFAMNAGMYMTDNSPLGLYVEKGKVLAKLNRRNGNGNFYIKPNGVFVITTDNGCLICTTDLYSGQTNVYYATQSGPMLVINGAINPAFGRQSTARNIRNGVGILPGNQVLFAKSAEDVTFYEFAKYFSDNGCLNALYLDGAVSTMFVSNGESNDLYGNLGVMVGVASPMP